MERGGVATTCKVVRMLEAEEVADTEGGGVGGMSLHEVLLVGLVAEDGVELVVATSRVLMGLRAVESSVNVVGWGVAGECAGCFGPGSALGATQGSDRMDGVMELGRQSG